MTTFNKGDRVRLKGYGDLEGLSNLDCYWIGLVAGELPESFTVVEVEMSVSRIEYCSISARSRTVTMLCRGKVPGTWLCKQAG